MCDDPDCPENLELTIKKDLTLEEQIELLILKHNTVVLHGEINEENCSKICKRLLVFHFMKTKEIDVILNTVGGEVYHGLLIFNTMEDLKKKGMRINVEARGVCASMGVIILMGGTTRTASKYSRFLMHEISSWVYGKASEVKEESEELAKVNRMLDQIVADRTKLNFKTLQKRTKKRDWWLSAEEALEYGLIEKIV